MGVCLLNTRQYAAARTYYKKAELNALNLQDSVNVAYLMLQIGISYSNTQNTANAILYTHNALKYDPNLHRQQLDSARYYLKKASVSTDDSEKLQAQYYKQLYQIAELKKDYQSALNHYKKYTTYITDYQLNKTEERIDNIVNRHHQKKWQRENRRLVRQRMLLVNGSLVLALQLKQQAT